MKKGMYKFLVTISCLTLCMSFFIVPVKAESDLFYPAEYSYTAYNHFITHGYSDLILTTSGNVTYNVNLDNIGTNNGTITGTDGLSGSSHETGTVGTNGSATLGSKYMTCSTNTGTSNSITYSCYFSSSSYGVNNSQSINIQMNENTYEDYGNVDVNVNESINQRINTDITGTITSSSGSTHYMHLPWIKGTYVKDRTWSWGNAIRLSPDYDFYFIFYTKPEVKNINRIVDFYSYSGNPSGVTPSYTWTVQFFNGMYLNYVKLSLTGNSGAWYVPGFNGIDNQDVLPIYFGSEVSMPDNVAELIGLRKSVGYILNKGNDNTSSSLSAANNANSQVSQKIGQFDNIENESVTDMNIKISNLNLTSDILSNSKFLSSAQWVKTQFDRMTVSTPIGSVLSFSLILGMTLIFLGKIR